MRQVGAEVVYVDGRRLRFLPSDRAQEGDWVEVVVQWGWFSVFVHTAHLQDSGIRVARRVASYPSAGVEYVLPVYDQWSDPQWVDMVVIEASHG